VVRIALALADLVVGPLPDLHRHRLLPLLGDVANETDRARQHAEPKAIGLVLAQSLLLRADEVIQ